MHPNKFFRHSTKESNIDFAIERSFGTLVVVDETLPLISHIPFQLSEDGLRLEAHLVASNPILQVLHSPKEATMVVSGADAYISPDWYGVEEQVPTWNYVAVHLVGTISKLEPKDLKGVLERLSKNMEDRLLPKPPWKLDKLGETVFAKLSRQIVPIVIDVKEIKGTWKLSQNKPDEVRLRAADAVRNSSIGSEVNVLSALMNEIAEEEAPSK